MPGKEQAIHDRAERDAGLLALVFAALALALHVATLGAYGYFRDELYYLACADRLAWGYVDHPPLSIAVLAGWRALVGDGLAALHVLPALVAATIVWAAGRLVVALGGGRLAVVLACTAVLTSPGRIGFDGYVSMNCIDALVWVLAAWLIVRVHASDARRDWCALGVVLGLGLLNKWSVLWLGAGLAVALLATPWRTVLLRRGPWLAAGIAMLLFAPNLAWEAAHDWPTLEFMRTALAEKYVRPSPLDVVGELVRSGGPAAAPLWITGIVAPFVGARLRSVRPLAWVFLTAAAIVIGTGGKAEYLLAALLLPTAIGAVALARLLARTRLAIRIAVVGTLLAAQLVLTAIALPFARPMLPVPEYVAYAKRLGVTPSTSEKKALGELPQFYADMHGWPELVDATERAWSTLSPAEREYAVIWAVTGGYGPAAAIDVLGRRRGLPGAIAGHNNYWLWGWGDADGSVVVLLGGPEDRLRELFERLDRVDTVECAPCMPYEDHKPVWIGRGMRQSFAEIWPRVKHYD